MGGPLGRLAVWLRRAWTGGWLPVCGLRPEWPWCREPQSPDKYCGDSAGMM